MEHPVELDRLTALDAEGHEVLDLEVDHVTHPHAVAKRVVLDVEGRALRAEHLPDQRREALHGPTGLTGEYPAELLKLLVARVVVDEHPHAPVALGHHLRRVGDQGDLAARQVDSVRLAVTNIEDERHAAVVVRGPVVEREVARAHQLARARLRVAALQAPGHSLLLYRARKRFSSARSHRVNLRARTVYRRVKSGVGWPPSRACASATRRSSTPPPRSSRPRASTGRTWMPSRRGRARRSRRCTRASAPRRRCSPPRSPVSTSC